MASGNQQAQRAFRRSLFYLEYILIAAVPTVTAAMTTFYSPDANGQRTIGCDLIIRNSLRS